MHHLPQQATERALLQSLSLFHLHPMAIPSMNENQLRPSCTTLLSLIEVTPRRGIAVSLLLSRPNAGWSREAFVQDHLVAEGFVFLGEQLFAEDRHVVVDSIRG